MPDWKPAIQKRLAAMHLPPLREHDIVEELAQHLNDRYDELCAEGATHEEAYGAAVAELQEGEFLREQLRHIAVRDAREVVVTGAPSSGNWLADLFRDARYGWRALWQTPSFTLIAVVTLALGIGANAAVFTVINALLLNPLPVVERPSELAAIYTKPAKDGSRGGNLLQLSYPNYADMSKSDAFSSFAAYSSPVAVTFSRAGTAERMFAQIVTTNFFDTLGIRPAAGRFFVPEEGRTGDPSPVAILSYGAWQTRFGGAADIVGQNIVLNNVPLTVIGVAPAHFLSISAVFGPDMWIPAPTADRLLPESRRRWIDDRGNAMFTGAARLKPGVTMKQAAANLNTIAAALAQEYPDTNRGFSVAMLPIREAALAMQPTARDNGQPLAFGGIILMAIVGIVLLIACSNVANLLLARASGRRHEIAVRMALGAGRGRLIRQLLTESVLIAMLSGAFGLLLASAGTQLLVSLRPPEFANNLATLSVDGPVLLFTLAVSFTTGIVFGIVPALQSSRTDVIETLKEEMRTLGRSRRRLTTRNVLLVGQVALSLVSLITAALFLRSIQRAYQIDPGFQTRKLAVFMTSPGQAGFSQPRAEQFYRGVRSRLPATPGIRSVSWASNLPLWGRIANDVVIEGREQRDKKDTISSVVNTIDLDYFETAGVPILHGREFTEHDDSNSVPVAVINENMARTYWPNQDAIGKRFRFSGEKSFRQVIGIVRTANYQTLGEPPQPCIYIPLRQNYSDTMVLYIRTERDPNTVIAGAQRILHDLAPKMPVVDIRTGTKIIDQALWGAKMGVGLLAVFGALALLLACVGLYGIMSYSVNQRKREIGVRMALGASQANTLRLVLRQGMGLVAAGALIGIGASVLVGRALSSLLVGVSASDPISIGAASVVLLAVALVACAVPAIRASRVDPLTALRQT